MNDLIFWNYPSLNYALKYISLKYNKLYGLHKFTLLMLENAKNNAIIFYIPELIQSTRTDTNGLVEKYIIKKCQESSMVAHQFIWSLEVEEQMTKVENRFLPYDFRDRVSEVSRDLLKIILKNLNPMQRKLWVDEDSYFKMITDVSGKFLHPENSETSLTWDKNQKSTYVRNRLDLLPKNLSNHIYLPTNPDTRILEMITNSAVSLQSAKKVPFIVSFVAEKYDVITLLNK